MKRESTVVELNETPRSSGRQKERKSRDRVFIRAATVEKRENDSQCRSTFTRRDEFRPRLSLWFRDGSKSWRSFFHWVRNIKDFYNRFIMCVCVCDFWDIDNIIDFIYWCTVNGIYVKCNETSMCKNKRLIQRFVWLENINRKITIRKIFSRSIVKFKLFLL